MAKFILGATERIKKDDSVPVELLPSNKLLYIAKLNNDEDAEAAPVRCNNLKKCSRSSDRHSRPNWNHQKENRSTPISRSRR